MYTKLDDQRQAKFVIGYITAHPVAALKKLCKNALLLEQD
jgi:hypothetical protein